MATQESYQVIARRYRPQLFRDVVGQRAVVEMLHNEIKEGRVGHGYLFSGPRGTGKTSMARIFAKALNCTHGPTTEPCGECSHCEEIAAGHHLDVSEVDAATYTKVDNMRDLLEGLQRSPFTGRHKVYIIDEVHMLSNSSFNALLKSLEEPPAHVVFILCTTNPEKIPETVVSRCRRCNFDRISASDITANLGAILEREGVTLHKGEEKAILSALALASDGGLRDAQVLLDQLISLAGSELRLETVRSLLGVVESDLFVRLLEALVDRDTQAALVLVGELVDHGRDLQRFVKMFLSFLRDVLLLRAGGDASLARLVDPASEETRALLERASLPFLLNAVQQFLDLEERMRGAAPPRFLMEFTLIKLTAIDPRLLLDSPTPPAGGGARPPAPGGPRGGTRQGGAPATTRSAAPAAPLAADSAAPTAQGSAPEMREAALLNEAAEHLEPQIEEIPTTDADRWRAFVELFVERDRAVGSALRHARLGKAHGGKLHIVLDARERAMKPMLERPEHLAVARDSARRAWGQNMIVFYEVEEVAPTPVADAPVAHPGDAPRESDHEEVATSAEGSEEFGLEVSFDRVAPASDGERAPAPSRLSAPLSFEAARREYPDFDAACSLVEEHFGVKAFRFSGKRLQG